MRGLQPLLEEVLDAMMGLHRADFGLVHLVETREKRPGGRLRSAGSTPPNSRVEHGRLRYRAARRATC